jgi:hypothetical protein
MCHLSLRDDRLKRELTLERMMDLRMRTSGKLLTPMMGMKNLETRKTTTLPETFQEKEELIK